MWNRLNSSCVIGQGLGILFMLRRLEALGSSTEIQTQPMFMWNRTDKDVVPDTTLHWDYWESLGSELQLNIFNHLAPEIPFKF